MKRYRVGNLGVLKATSDNATKRSSPRLTTMAGKSVEAVIKQFATQELQGEKRKMKEWKEIVMQEVACELSGIKQMHEGAMEALRQSFQLELERMGGKVEQLESEVKALKFPGQQLARKILPAKTVAPLSTGGQDEREEVQTEQSEDPNRSQIYWRIIKNSTPTQAGPSTKPIPEKRNYAAVAASKPTKAPEQPWTQVKYKNCKPNSQQSAKSISNAEYQERRILFPRKVIGQQKSEADLMLALNKGLQKAGEGPMDTRFCRVKYSPSEAVSALLTEKANTGLLVLRLSNILIRAAKTIDPAIVGVEVLEHWQRLKVHGMSLDRYLGEGKMELLKSHLQGYS